jgi:hypothetical protein
MAEAILIIFLIIQTVTLTLALAFGGDRLERILISSPPFALKNLGSQSGNSKPICARWD